MTELRRATTRRRLPSGAGAPITTLVMPRCLYVRTIRAAARLNWSQAEVIRTALEEFLRRRADDLRETPARW